MVVLGYFLGIGSVRGEEAAPKRGQPTVLLPVEGTAVVVHTQLQTYEMDKRGERLFIKVLVDPRPPDQRTTPTTNLKPIFVDIDKLADRKDVVKTLLTIRPLRQAIVVAAFPYRAQVEEFRKQLGLGSCEAVLGEESRETEGESDRLRRVPAFRFLNVVAERRLVTLDGKPIDPIVGDQGWRPLDLAEDFKPLLVLTGGRTEPDDKKMRLLMFPGLVMPCLLQARPGQYPDVEYRLPRLKQSVTQFEAAMLKGDKTALPEYCVVRIIDWTINPGERYQYRLGVRMANPNYRRDDVVDPKFADDKELKPADPKNARFVIPGIVSVPTEMHLYAVDQKDIEKPRYQGPYARDIVGRDQTVLQIHKYLEYAAPMRGDHVPVGEWVVAERIIVGRGEQVDRKVRIEVPCWSEAEERFVILITGTEVGPQAGADVSIAKVIGRPMVLVDFNGGPLRYVRGAIEVRDQASQEVLLMDPCGRLLAHNSAVDAADRERTTRLAIWRKRLEELRNAVPRSPYGPPSPFGRPNP
jgi:hypothetical protein